MCFTNVASVVCPSCHRSIGERAVSTTPCNQSCGKFVSRLVGPDQRIFAPCAVCAAKEDERKATATRLSSHFSASR
ncbi:hypothetical protein HJFPF1_12718 [Paramyrothecium foliicola]|nr:hypothetical protein HJFPF1_12718 [Paramyrothecium foliicola]